MSHFEKKVQLNKIIESQLPEFLVADFPKAVEFFKQYYISQEAQGSNIDLVDNLDRYIKLDNLIPEVVIGKTTLSEDINASDTTITVASTKGYPDEYGLLKIDDEIITYTGKTDTSFTGCIRGFSGVTGFDDTTKAYFANTNRQSVIFENTVASNHSANATIQNLSALFLQEFYKKLKKTFTPGFEEETFVSDLNVSTFIKHARNFYQSKGIEESIIILFKVLYGVTAKVIDLESRLIKPSSADYIRREVVVAERISGDPFGLEGQTIFKSNDLETNAAVSEVEIFTRDNISYYKLGLFIGYNDRDLVEGVFTIPGYSKVLETVNPGDSVISVDSTIGFDQSGTLVSGNNTITYTSKSVNQFFGCNGVTNTINVADPIRSDEFVFGYENSDVTKKCELRITGVLSDFEALEDISLMEVDEIITVKSVGDVVLNPTQNKTNREIFANSWIYNTKARFEVKSISDSTFFLYSNVDKSLRVGDTVDILIGKSNEVVTGGSNALIQSITSSSNNVAVTLTNISDFTQIPGQSYSIRRNLIKANSLNTPIKEGNDVYIANTLNVYTDDSEEFGYVASNSLPGYQIVDKIIESSIPDGQESNFDGYNAQQKNWKSIKFSSAVRFLNGDIVKYTADNPLSGLVSGEYYYVKLLKVNEIELYSSVSSLRTSIESGTEQPVRFASNSLGGTHTFTLERHEDRQLSSNSIFRKIPLKRSLLTRDEDSRTFGNVGILVDGVEINSPDSRDEIYFGPLEKFEVLNRGKGYDVINPPEIKISSGTSNALVEPVIVGNVKEVLVDPQDFDVESVISISLTGGNGNGCNLKPVLGKRFREVSFDSRPLALGGGVDITNETITFNEDHNFITGQPIIYNRNGNDPLAIGNFGDSTNTPTGTLGSGDQYYARFVNTKSIRLYFTESDALVGVNTVGLSEAVKSGGIHKFRTLSKTNLRQIKVLDSGSGYTHRKLRVKPSGISTVYNTISFKDHGFETGEIVNYSTTGNSISALNTSNQYQINKIDSDTFKLINVGIGGTNTTDIVRSKFVDFTDTGSGYHVFQYPPIEVTANVSFGGQTGSLTLTPTITGEIVDAYLYENGTGYGSTTLNLYRKPIITISGGKNAQFLPIISNGKIVDVQILSGGQDYISTPELIIEDTTGTGAILRPVVVNGKITDVIVINEGLGYSDNSTLIKIKSRGFGAKFDTRIRKLIVNDAQRFSKFSKNQNEKIFSNLSKNEKEDSLVYGIFGYSEDLAQNLESLDSSHSPIIGWAYDGNPIYGPYGYSDPTNIQSGIRVIKPSYELSTSSIVDRPDFEDGFFIEDYRYTGSGDLDKHNGRFGKTPDYPNGVYAYFVGVTTDVTSSTPADFEPHYPYFVGNTYQSKFIRDNLTLNHNFDFNNSNLARNTYPYNIGSREDYDFIDESYKTIEQLNYVKSVSQGIVDRVNVISGGTRYKIGDKVNFDNENTNGSGLRAEVSELVGVAITSLNTTLESYENVVFVWNSETEVFAFNDSGFEIFDKDTVVVSGLSTSVNSLTDSFTVGFSTETVALAATMTEYPNAITYGKYEDIIISRKFNNVSIGNSIRIVSDQGTEIVKVLNDFGNGVLRVHRPITQNGPAHGVGARLELLNDKIVLPVKTKAFNSKRNDTVYFNAEQSVGVGITPGGAVEKSFSIGDTNTTVNIPFRQIRIPNHPFKTGQKVTFENSIVASDLLVSIEGGPSANTFFIPTTQSELYVINKGPDYIGLTTQVGFTTAGDGLFFHNTGSDNSEYKLTSTFKQLTGDLSKVSTKIGCASTHGLQVGDTIKLTVNPNTIVGIGTTLGVTGACNAAFDADNQLLLINRVGVDSTGISSATNSITLNNHGYKTGDKLFYESDEVATGLIAGKSYYVVRNTSNTFKLAETLYETNSSTEKIINITGIGDSSHKFSLINPQINVTRNSDLQIKLDHPSLTGYELNIYRENEFINEYNSSSNDLDFNVIKVGTPGSANASLTLKYSDSIPSKLFYSLEKGGYISTADKSVNNFSQINYIDSEYNGTYNVFGIESKSFNISPSKSPQILSYTPNQCDSLKYTVKSTNIDGSISKVDVISNGFNYERLPKFKDVISVNGTNANVEPISSSIGRIKKTRFSDVGYNYSSDKTLRPEADVPPVVRIDNLDTIVGFDIVNPGSRYISEPDVLLWNDTTNKVVDSTSLIASAEFGSITEINQLAPILGLQSEPHRIVTINNSNGVGISSIQTSVSGVATCTLNTPLLGFTVSPFSTGDFIFVEGIEMSDNGIGYNSADHNYKFFEVINYQNSNPDVVTFQVTDANGLIPANIGIAKTNQSGYATLVNSKNYPDIKVLQNRDSFAINENLLVNVGGGYVETDLTVSLVRSDYIKIKGKFDLEKGHKIKGLVSGCTADVTGVDRKRSKFNINYSSKLDIGWKDDIGKISEDYQVIPDNDYFQNLSYSVKSPITWDEFSSPVNSILHPAGLKNFADVGISSVGDAQTSIGGTAKAVVILDVTSESKVDTINMFDVSVDDNPRQNPIGEFLESNSLEIKNKRLTDYTECKTNRVLLHDDISDKFSSSGFKDVFKEIEEIDILDNHVRYLIQIVDPDTSNIQVTELVLQSTVLNTYLFTKYNTFSEKLLGTFRANVDSFGRKTLLFDPVDPYNTDHDIKILKKTYLYQDLPSGVSGIGTENIGSINLTSTFTSGISSVGTATSTKTLVEFDVNDFNGAFATIEIRDRFGTNVNYVEAAIDFDGTNTGLSEYYFDSENISYSSIQTGILTTEYDSNSGIVSLTASNNEFLTDVYDVRSSVVGFGTTTSGIGTYRFLVTGQPDETERSARLESTFGEGTGPIRLGTFNIDEISSSSSIVRVSAGQSSAIHQVTVIANDIEEETYVTPGPFAPFHNTTGLGTFGSEISGDNFYLNFYPDPGYNVKAQAFNEVFYRFNDFDNTPQTLEFGPSEQNIVLSAFDGLNGERANRVRFVLTHENDPIYTKEFNPADTTKLNYDTGLFTFPNHFFNTGEELIYTPKSTFAGVGQTAVGIGTTENYLGISTDKLPEKVYPIAITPDTFKLATKEEYARAGIFVTFTDAGEGNAHELEFTKKLSKTVIALDGIVQQPITFTPISHTLNYNAGGINAGIATFNLSGISSIQARDLLRIDDEYMKVIEVGFSTNFDGEILGPINGIIAAGTAATHPTVSVKRGVVGSAATSHTDGTNVQIYRGSFNIVKNEVFFADPPKGNTRAERDESNLPYVKAQFSGRTFLRSNYDANFIFDDISDNFTGIGKTHTLTVGGANTSGITPGNGILFINGVFQTPTTENNAGNNYEIESSSIAGVSTVIFTGITSTDGTNINSSDDINQNQIPRGGLVVSLGSTPGLGYAPLVGAKVKASVGTGGTISEIVGFNTYVNPVAIHTAAYDKFSGNLNIETVDSHNLRDGDSVQLVGLHFTCTPAYSGVTTTIFPDHDRPFDITNVISATKLNVNVGTSSITHHYVGQGEVYEHFSLNYGSGYREPVSIAVTDRAYEHRFERALTNAITANTGTQFTPTAAKYTSHTGALQLTIPNHGLTDSNTITITEDSLFFRCSDDNFFTEQPYPRSTDPAYNSNLGITTFTGTTITVNVGPAGGAGTGAIVEATVGAGGTLAFNIVNEGSGYVNPVIQIPEPIYENMPVVGVSRLGVGATTDTGQNLLLNLTVGAASTTVGIGSTLFLIDSYKIARNGYAFKPGDVMEVVGLVTAKDYSEPIHPFQLEVVSTFNDFFSAWTFGEMDYIDSVKEFQDGKRKRFPLFYNGALLSFELDEDEPLSSAIDLDAVLLIFVNGVLQTPGYAYTFPGGTSFIFTEAPGINDKVDIFFYLGQNGVDVKVVNITETVKIGDDLFVQKHPLHQETSNQLVSRTVSRIISSKNVQTPIYSGPGVNQNIFKPINWTKQKRDKYIEDSIVFKTRKTLEPKVFPTSKIISDINTDSANIFVDNAQFFRYEEDEYGLNIGTFDFDGFIVEHSEPVSANLSPVVSASGTVTVDIIDGGSGYTPGITSVSIAPPAGGVGDNVFRPTITNRGGIIEVGSSTITGINTGSIVSGQSLARVFDGQVEIIDNTYTVSSIGNNSITLNKNALNVSQVEKRFDFGIYQEQIRAEATATVSAAGTISAVSVTNPGAGYTTSNPPKAIVGIATARTELITNFTNVEGFSGIITGISETTGSTGRKAIKFNYRALSDYTIEGELQNAGGSLGTLDPGYPIMISNTKVGNGVVSLYDAAISDSAIVGIGTSFLDNVYIVDTHTHGNTADGEIICNVTQSSDLSSIASVGNFSDTDAGLTTSLGRMSWGRLYNGTDGITRDNPIAIGVSGLTVDSGLSAFPTIQRRGDFGEGQTGAIRSTKPGDNIVSNNYLSFYLP